MLFDEIKLPVQKRSKARLELVLETTKKILEEQGINYCTIPEIAAQSDLPKITIYQYFPTVNHLFSILVKRYLDELQAYVLFKNECYQTWSTRDICFDLISKVAEFYNSNPAASILILGGPVHVDGFNLQEIVIEKIAHDLQAVFEQKVHPLKLNRKGEAVYLVEMVFALMKHSYYQHQQVTDDILKECHFISEFYLSSKGYNYQL